MRKPIIAGNWKMYKLVADSVATAQALKPLVSNANHCEVVIAPVFTALKTVALFARALADARTIIWNGPMGMFEEKGFEEGTVGLARVVADAADGGATVIVGGGDSVSAVTQAGVAERITHISTGGGATLEFIAGEELPGVAALNEK